MIRSRLRTFGECTAVAWILAAAAGAAMAQIPDKFTNLQVLPKEIVKGDLTGRMREITLALGVRCGYCHLGPDNLQGMDFASDEKPAKRTARVMMKMVEEINGRLIKGVESARPAKVLVRCQTCHHGVAVPEPIEDIVARTLESGGAQAALAGYRELRAKHHGGGAYDFSEVPLNTLADRLLRSGKTDGALALLLVSDEYHPDTVWTMSLLGMVHKARGEKEKAIAAYRKVLALDTGNAWAKKQIEELTAEAGKPE